MCDPVLKCHQLQWGFAPLTFHRGLCPLDPTGGSHAPVLTILWAKPTLVLFSGTTTDCKLQHSFVCHIIIHFIINNIVFIPALACDSIVYVSQ